MTHIPSDFAHITGLLGRPEEVVVLRGGLSPLVFAKSPRAVYEVLMRKEGLYIHPPHPFASMAESYAPAGACLLGLQRASDRDFFSAAVHRCFEQSPPLDEAPSVDIEARLKHWCARLLMDLLWQASSPSLDRFVTDVATHERPPAGAPKRGIPSRDAFLADLFATSPGLAGLDVRDRAARDAVIRTFLNGYNALAIALVWSLIELARAPALRGRLRRDPELMPGLIAEILRLYPPAWALARRLIQDDELCGLELPAGTAVQVSPFVTHRDPGYWSQPEKLQLSRSRKARQSGELRYFPFGAGARICPSARFVPALLQCILEQMLARWDFQLVETSNFTPVGWTSLHPVPSPKISVRSFGCSSGGTHRH